MFIRNRFPIMEEVKEEGGGFDLAAEMKEVGISEDDINTVKFGEDDGQEGENTDFNEALKAITGEDEGSDDKTQEGAKEGESHEDESEGGEGEENEEGSGEKSETAEIEVDGKKYEIPAELKDGFMKNADYTQKTQELAEERKGFESEKQEAEKIFSERVDELTQQVEAFTEQKAELETWQHVLNNLKNDDPDLFDDLKDRFSQVDSQFNNPVYNQRIQEIENKLNSITEETQKQSSEMTIKEFELELGKHKELTDKFEKLGVKINPEEVKEEWANTGLSVDRVLYSLYGDKAIKLADSKEKVNQTKQSTKRPKGVGTKSRRGSSGKKLDSVKWGRGDTAEQIGQMLGVL